MASNLDPAEDIGSPAAAVVAAVQSPAAVSLSAPMIGRDGELQRLLHELYRVIETGEARLVTVVGAPGIGKSRLAHELRQVVARLPEPVGVIGLQADGQSTGQPYSLVRLLVAALFRIREGDAPATARLRLVQGVAALLGPHSLEQAHLLGQLAGYDLGDSPQLRGPHVEPRQPRERALAALRQCLVAHTAQLPLVLICDDLHDADGGSLDALAALLGAGPPIGALVVCLAQGRLYERRPAWGGVRIELGPLDERSGRRLVGELLCKAGKLPSELRAMIVSRAEGNPFYVEELIKMLLADGVIVPGPTTWQIRQGRLSRKRIPHTLSDLLRARLAALLPAERELLMRAAVVGRLFWAAAALQLHGAAREHGGADGLRAAGELLASLERKQLIMPLDESRFPGQREYAFCHELMHEVAYEQVPPDMRQVYHRQVAEWLVEVSGARAGAFAGLIADHYERGGRSRKAAGWALQAGRHARTTGALETALAHYRRALALLPDDAEAIAERIICYEGLGKAQTAIARLGDAGASYLRMAELADQVSDLAAAARAWNGMAFVLDYSLDYKAAEDSAGRALALAEAAGDSRQLAIALYHVAWAELRNERVQQAIALAQRALEAIGHGEDPATAARCTGVIGLAYEQLGDYAAARANLERALGYNRALGDRSQIATLLNNLGYVANMQGDYDAALAFLEEGLQIAEESRTRLNEIYLLTNLAQTYVGRGAYAAAEAAARRGLELCQTSRITAYSDFSVALSAASLGQGRVIEAVEAAQQALDTARASEGPREVAAACRALGSAIGAMSESQGARPCFEESARSFAEVGAAAEQARTLRAWALFELRSGDPERGRELYRQARALLVGLALEHELARTPAEPPAPYDGPGAFI